MIPLFAEKYRAQINTYHKVGISIAALLVVVGLSVFVFSLFLSSSLLPKDIRFKMTMIGFICIPAGLAIFLAIKSSVQNQHPKIQQMKRCEEQLTVDSRLGMVNDMHYNKFDYHTATRRTLENILFIMALILIVTFLRDALILGLILLVFMTIACGIIWIIGSIRKNDFVKLAADGISFRKYGEAGFMRWDQIREIEYDRQGFTIKTNEVKLRIMNDIKPADVSPNIFKRFFANTRYDRDLVSQIKKLAPHVRDVQWYNYSRL